MARVSTAQWTEPASSAVVSQFTRAYLVESEGSYALSLQGPAEAVFREDAGELRLDDEVEGGSRIVVNDTKNVLIY